MLFETADRPPKAGSLKEALFLTVWLRRQEQRVQEQRILAQGLTDLIQAVREVKDEPHIQEVFQKYIESVFPFLVKEEEEKRKRIKETLTKEAEGIITFRPAGENFVRRQAKVMQMDDEWARKLRERAERKG